MIHPNPGNAVPVCFELSCLCPHDRGIAAIHADASKIIEQILVNLRLFGQQHSQQVLPEVPPTAPTAAVVMKWQKGIAHDPSEDGLQGNPSHPTVQPFVLLIKLKSG